MAILGQGTAVVEEIDGTWICAKPGNESLVRIHCKHISGTVKMCDGKLTHVPVYEGFGTG